MAASEGTHGKGSAHRALLVPHGRVVVARSAEPRWCWGHGRDESGDEPMLVWMMCQGLRLGSLDGRGSGQSGVFGRTFHCGSGMWMRTRDLPAGRRCASTMVLTATAMDWAQGLKNLGSRSPERLRQEVAKRFEVRFEVAERCYVLNEGQWLRRMCP